MKKEKTKTKKSRKKSSTTITLVQPLLIKRSATDTNFPEPPTKYQRTHSTQSVSTAALRKQTLTQKKQEKITEEQTHERLCKELQFLSTPDLNLFDFDPFGQKSNEIPSTPVRLPKKRRRPKKVLEPSFTDFIPDSELEQEPIPIIIPQKPHVPAVLVSQPIEALSINIPPLDEVLLPNVLQESTKPTSENLIVAEKDALTIFKISSLQKENLWAPKRIPRIPAPPRGKTHWDYVLAEMVWMANDFRQERKFKITQAKKLCRSVVRKQKNQQILEEKKKKEKKAEIKRVASFIAGEVKSFWSKIEVLVKHKHEVKLEEKVLEARGQQLEFLVGQTERYSNKLAQDLQSSSSKNTNTDNLSLNNNIENPSDIYKNNIDNDEEPKIMEIDENDEENERKDIIHKAAEYATIHQPTGTTLSTTSIKTKVPDLIRGTLREYQHIGLDWLVSMYDAKLNGILADEMGLGKTIMTISLLAYLANEYGIWGPHLIVVPTSVMLNWERELKRWCPGLKVLTYYGSQKERKQKRKGWSKPNAFHVCITSYNLVSQDKVMLGRKKWVYLILDEAQNIKNFKSQRWQALLNFNTRRRLLLTGTPLQNSLMELWSLMHFLMPHIFQSHSEFKEWFCNPVNNMIEGNTSVNEQLISRLHGVLRPFILRRLKKDVETQLPSKHEHIVPCSLSKRQRFLYDEFMSRGKTKESLEAGNYLSVLNVLMQLRKVCNHPDLFEERSISSPLFIDSITYNSTSLIWNINNNYNNNEKLSNNFLIPSFVNNELNYDSFYYESIQDILVNPKTLLKSIRDSKSSNRTDIHTKYPSLIKYSDLQSKRKIIQEKEMINHFIYIDLWRLYFKYPLYGLSLRKLLTMDTIMNETYKSSLNPLKYFEYSNNLLNSMLTIEERLENMLPILNRYCCYIPPVTVTPINIRASPIIIENINQQNNITNELLKPISTITYSTMKHRQLALPEKRLVQFDCGKLQKLSVLLRKLKSENHRVLIFTQMTRMLDILEIFLNLHGYTYMRLDGATKPEQRQALMERFNADDKIFAFILSTRSGGCGVNLIGADTVIFYDSDWNPAMDSQAQDRCHRIGQTREVHIYRLISKQTIEENILKKANQKRLLDSVAIEGAKFTTDFFQNIDINTFVSEASSANISKEQLQSAMNSLEDENDVIAMKEAQKELDAEYEEFNDEVTQTQSINDETEYIKSNLTQIQKYLFKNRIFKNRNINIIIIIIRYAYRYLEEVAKIIDEDHLEELHGMVEVGAEKWKRDTLKRIKETENAMENNERLYYEVVS